MNIQIIHDKCDLCGMCEKACPFNAIEIVEGKVNVALSCRFCRLCIKSCLQGAIQLLEINKHTVNKQEWKGVMVVAEQNYGKLHPVTFELLGEAERLSKVTGHPVYALIIGKDISTCAEELLHYGPDEVFVCEHQGLEHFRADTFADAVQTCIETVKPGVVLTGATSLGRSLAPRLSARMRTGLTADCTQLKMKDNTDLVQIRPAFGGNIMAQIVTPETRPQFATVRYKVMQPYERMREPKGKLTYLPLGNVASNIKVLEVHQQQSGLNISECEVLVVAGRGIKDIKDLAMLEDLAGSLGGQLACTRPLVENGWVSYIRQIGLSGRTVKPKLIITCGVSGAVQFTAAMASADCIIAINKDPNASIFRVAHYSIVGDVYEIIPRLIHSFKGASQHAGNQLSYSK